MRSSFSQSGRGSDSASTPILKERITANRQPGLFTDPKFVAPGSMNDAIAVRAAIVASIKNCGKSRQVIAEEMSHLTGTSVTARRINAFTAESKEDYRFPAELARAFCVATDDFSLLRDLAELAGLRLISASDYELLELGRQFLIHKRAEQTIAMLERKLGGVDL